MNKIKKCPCCFNKFYKTVLSINKKNLNNFKMLDNKYYNNKLFNMIDIEEIKIAKCLRCHHHWYLNQPSLENLKNMYTNKILKEKNHLVHKKNIEKNVTILKKLSNGKNFLDFGSGLNNLWEEIATKHKFNYYGYDPFLQKKRKLKNYYNSFDKLRNKKFDIINLNQVLEHVADLDSTLEDLQKFCNKDTIVKVSVPNVLRPREKILEKFYNDWPYNYISLHTMSPFEHLHGFTSKSLKELFWRKNFKIKHSLKIIYLFNHYYFRQYLNNTIPKLSTTEMIFRF